jgi:hypothetical protein
MIKKYNLKIELSEYLHGIHRSLQKSYEPIKKFYLLPKK